MTKPWIQLLSQSFAFALLCVLAQPAFAVNEADHRAMVSLPFSLEPSLPVGHQNIDSDLLELQKAEFENLKSNLSKNLTAEQKYLAVSKVLQGRNQELLKEMNDFSARSQPDGFSERKISALSKSQARSVLEILKKHPVTSEKALSKYDTWDRMIGYCFGRATFVHWELLRRQVNSASISKIFVVGKLRYQDSGLWDFHVATAVKSTDGSWWVIDSLFEEPVKVEAWMNDVLKWDLYPNEPTMRFYWTDATKFQAVKGAYSAEKIFLPEYRGYFKDLIVWFQKNPLTDTDSFLQK